MPPFTRRLVVVISCVSVIAHVSQLRSRPGASKVHPTRCRSLSIKMSLTLFRLDRVVSFVGRCSSLFSHGSRFAKQSWLCGKSEGVQLYSKQLFELLKSHCVWYFLKEKRFWFALHKVLNLQTWLELEENTCWGKLLLRSSKSQACLLARSSSILW